MTVEDPDFPFKLDVSIDDRTGRLRAAYLRVREGDAAETREVVEGLPRGRATPLD